MAQAAVTQVKLCTRFFIPENGNDIKNGASIGVIAECVAMRFIKKNDLAKVTWITN
jgi:hypothetical protein